MSFLHLILYKFSCHTWKLNQGSSSTEETLDHLSKIIDKKRGLLSRQSGARRHPKELSKPVLDDLVIWLLGFIYRPETEVRRKAMQLVNK